MSEIAAPEQERLDRAIGLAKSYFRAAFKDEKIEGLALEEVEQSGSLWKVTLGFNRDFPLSSRESLFMSAAAAAVAARPQRVFKVVEFSDDDRFGTFSIKNRHQD